MLRRGREQAVGLGGIGVGTRTGGSPTHRGTTGRTLFDPAPEGASACRAATAASGGLELLPMMDFKGPR